MEIEDIKILLNQWLQQVNFKSLVHDSMAEKYRGYDQWTKIIVTFLGIFTTFDIIFVGQSSNNNSFNILQILGIISTIIITILTAFEIHIKYPDSAEHHHILAILYSQIKREITSFLMKNGSTTRKETLDFYNKIQEQLYLIGTMEKDCYEELENKIELDIKKNNLDSNLNRLLSSKKKVKYSNKELENIQNLSNNDIINILKEFCERENITVYENFSDITNRNFLLNYLIGDLNIPYSFVSSFIHNDVVIEIIDYPKILCIDDDPVHNKILKNSIKDVAIECVLNSHIALEAINEKKYDLIIIDYKMPNISGIELTKIIRDSNTNNKKVPIIGISSYDDENIKQGCLNIGMNDFITKPVIKKKLLIISKYL